MTEPLNDPRPGISLIGKTLNDTSISTKSGKKEFKISSRALKAINTPFIRRRLMDALGCTEFTIARYIQKNSDNLTKAVAMEIIRETTGLTDDEILVN